MEEADSVVTPAGVKTVAGTEVDVVEPGPDGGDDPGFVELLPPSPNTREYEAILSWNSTLNPFQLQYIKLLQQG